MSLFLSGKANIHLLSDLTEMRKGVNGLFVLVSDLLKQNQAHTNMFVFRGKRSDKIKILYWDGQGFCIFYKRLERGKFIWPKGPSESVISITEAQLSMLLEGIDWRFPVWSSPPEYAS
jgi:transposase